MDNYQQHDLTAVSFTSVVPAPPERRGEVRQTSLLRIGKLSTALDQRLCMIRNISSAGAMLKLYQPIAVGAAVAVEITPVPMAFVKMSASPACAPEFFHTHAGSTNPVTA